MSDESPTAGYRDTASGRPLAPWTYSNPELFDLEYQMLFLHQWQLIGHVSEVRQAGDFVAGNIGRDGVFVIRDAEDRLRAFQNVCRHRASRILEGSGHCRGVIKCPYHGWTYRLDGSLLGVPQEDTFPGIDRSDLGLHEIELEVFHGLLFVRLEPGGTSVAADFAHTARFFEDYGVADYEPCAPAISEVWEVNWKVAWDNYMENYHIPVGHPGLFRLLVENDEWEDLPSSVNYGTFLMKDKPSNVEEERRYQELLPRANGRLPESLHGRWVQFGYNGNLGIDLYPEMMDLFQLIPLGPDKSLVRASYYGHRDPTPDEQELRRLNMAINMPVNDEDRELCGRVQQGLLSRGYQPGPLSQHEAGIFRFRETIRRALPVAGLEHAPAIGQVAAENLRLSAGTRDPQEGASRARE